MEKQGLNALVDLAERTGVLTLESALEGRVTEECLSMYNIDGSMWKIMKSKLLEQFNIDPVIEELEYHTSRIDMGVIWHLATPTHDDCEARKWDGSDFRLQVYRCINHLKNICGFILSRFADANPIILVNDRYDLPFSINDDDHD